MNKPNSQTDMSFIDIMISIINFNICIALFVQLQMYSKGKSYIVDRNAHQRKHNRALLIYTQRKWVIKVSRIQKPSIDMFSKQLINNDVFSTSE